MAQQPSKRKTAHGGRSDAAVWCETHRRRECSKNRRGRNERCHMVAIEGLDACRLHCGEKREAAKARGQANLLAEAFAQIGPAEYVDHGEVLQWALTRAYLRSLWVAAQIRELGAKGADLSDERVRILVEVEQGEAREAARVAKMAADAGIDERRLQISEKIAAQLIAVLRGVVTELGHDPGDPKVAGVVRRHLQLVAREAV